MNAHRQPQPSPAVPRPQSLNPRPSTLDRTGGFTLIELLVVIVIIAVLIGLITPAIFAAITNARVAEVRSEISQLEAAISSFQAEYGGIEPPSRITIPDIPGGESWNSFPRDKAIIRRIWPQFNFATNGGNTNLKGTLNGAECLVFFLGGIRDPSGSLTGFSKNPATPFVLGGNRIGPFFEFELGRLTESGGNPDAPEYKDTLPSQTTPYVYLSSYDGRGYRSAELTDFDTDATTTIPEKPSWWTLTSWYTQPGGTSVAYKPNSYQIISPGADGQLGDGGVYDPDDESTVSEAERDNITNFTSGRLVP